MYRNAGDNGMYAASHDYQVGQYLDKFGKPYHLMPNAQSFEVRRSYYYTSNGGIITCHHCGETLK
tara:strand:+ start:4874 stop:5068 length:195 start_codon:yes stop_codon:yes gene_type:complete